jgi:hypothetical protein
MVSSISRSLPAPAAQPPPPHYKSLLTPLLHRRFVNACIVCCGFCYLVAFIISDKSSCELMATAAALNWSLRIFSIMDAVSCGGNQMFPAAVVLGDAHLDASNLAATRFVYLRCMGGCEGLY